MENDLDNSYKKVSNGLIQDILKDRYNIDLSKQQIYYYKNNLDIQEIKRDKNQRKRRIRELNDFFNDLTYIEVKHLYNMVKKVYQYHNKDIKEFDFKKLDNSLTYRENKTEIKKELRKYGLMDMATKIDLNLM